MTIRVGIIGTDQMATTYGALLRKQRGVKITAVVDEDHERARQLVRKIKGRPYTDYEELISRVDIAYLFANLPKRVEIVSALAAAGKAIFCDVPLAATVAEGEEIAKIVHESGIPFMMNFNHRFRDPFRHLKNMTKEELTGDVTQVFSVRMGAPSDAEAHLLESPPAQGGLTLFSVCHDVDLLRWLADFHDVEAVHGQVQGSRPELPDFDDTAAATLRFAGGILGHIHASWTSHVEIHQLGFVAHRASAVAEGNEMWQIQRNRNRVSDALRQKVAAYTHDTTTNMGYKEASGAFIMALNEEAKPPISVDDGLAALRVCHGILGA